MLTTIAAGLAGALALGFGYEQMARRQERTWALPGRLVDVGGYRLHITADGPGGQGGPTVVILHGAGDSSYSWTYVRQQVARFARVVTYDRAGLGSSEPGPAPGTEHSVQELHTLLARVGVPGPYILVGHSLGGLIARLYALRYPEQVAGLVMVDATHEQLRDDRKFLQMFKGLGTMLRIIRALSPFGVPRFLGQVCKVLPMYPEHPYYQQQITPDEYRQWTSAFYRACAGEGGAKEFDACLPIIDDAYRMWQEAQGRPQLGDVPLVVITNPGTGDDWIAMQKEMAGRSTRGVQVVSDRPGHSPQMPRPELVIDAVRTVMDQAGVA